jgi:hypothetical protein
MLRRLCMHGAGLGTTKRRFVVGCVVGCAASLLVGCVAGYDPSDQDVLAGGAESEDDATVVLRGTVERVATDARPEAPPEVVADASVCLGVHGVATCTTTGLAGEYELRTARSDETADLTVTCAGFSTTTTRITLTAHASHALGLVPASSGATDPGRAHVLLRSYVKVYGVTQVMPSMSVQLVTGIERVSITTDAAGFAILDLPAGSPLDVQADGPVSCGLWGGSAGTFLATTLEAVTGVVTEMDVLCDVDRNDDR